MGRTQRVIADTVAQELNIPLRLGRRFLQRVIDIIADDIVYTGKVEIRGLGVFAITKRPAHKTKIPGTDNPVTIPEKKIAEFRASAAIRRRLNPSKSIASALKKKKRRTASS